MIQSKFGSRKRTRYWYPLAKRGVSQGHCTLHYYLSTKNTPYIILKTKTSKIVPANTKDILCTYNSVPVNIIDLSHVYSSVLIDISHVWYSLKYYLNILWSLKSYNLSSYALKSYNENFYHNAKPVRYIY